MDRHPNGYNVAVGKAEGQLGDGDDGAATDARERFVEFRRKLEAGLAEARSDLQAGDEEE